VKVRDYENKMILEGALTSFTLYDEYRTFAPQAQ